MISTFYALGMVEFPQFSGTRIMMMPVILGEPGTVPITQRGLVQALFNKWPRHHGKVGYLTIDERWVLAGTSHRAPGKHIDAPVNHGGGGTPPRPGHGAGGSSGGWGGGGGGWAGRGTGMLLVSDVAGCRAWRGTFEGEPGPEGECDHLIPGPDVVSQVLQPRRVYWCDGQCVHESLPFERDTRRALVRLSMPSAAPWYEGYTESPYGVQPTGPIMPRRAQMGYAA